MSRWAVIGAGFTGIAVAMAMIEAGLDVEVLDERTQVGGLWRDGTYDDVRLITTRKVSAFNGRPMAAGELFPSGAELLDYLTEVAEQSGVQARFLGGRRIKAVTPGDDGWDVDGERYDGVVLATGLFSSARIPALPGELTIASLHTADFKNVNELGEDVLVVGLGNSGADVAQQCVRAGKRVTMAIGRPRHVVPKRVMGQPVVALKRPPLVPDLPVRIALDVAVRALSAYWRYGKLSEPRHLILSEAPVVHSALLPLLSKGKIGVTPGVTRLAGDTVQFQDGSRSSFDTVVWATGYDYDLPVDRALLDGSDAPYGSTPLSLVGGAWSPISRGLAAVGHREPRHGRGSYLSAVSELVADGAVAQAGLLEPVGQRLSRVARPDATELIDDQPELRRLAALSAAARDLSGQPVEDAAHRAKA